MSNAVLHTSENLRTLSRNANVNPVSSTASFVASFVASFIEESFGGVSIVDSSFVDASFVDASPFYVPRDIIFVSFRVVTLLESS